jgi:hypothetical protein
MDDKSHIDIEQLFEEGTAIDEAVAKGVFEALRMHKLLGNTVVGWQDGQVVFVPPDQINLDPADWENPPIPDKA